VAAALADLASLLHAHAAPSTMTSGVVNARTPSFD
jgi:hypothetical protein